MGPLCEINDREADDHFISWLRQDVSDFIAPNSPMKGEF